MSQQQHLLIVGRIRRVWMYLRQYKGLLFALTSTLLLCMCFLSFFSSSSAEALTTAKSSKGTTATCTTTDNMSSTNSKVIESRLRGALWGFFAGDALSSPTHWYYGGFPQITSDYGPQGIDGYKKPVTKLPGSILNKSNTNGGGRGSFGGKQKSIIGDVINHGKLEYWNPKKSIHYHATLQAGENTLEAQIARVLMKSIVKNGGTFNADHFRDEYIKFMTTPDSHHDTYASTCHRMFFANLVLRNKHPKDCPDNDHHNVDTIDGLVLPTITALAMSATPGMTINDAALQSAQTASVTRRSKQLENYSSTWAKLVYNSIHETNDENMSTHINAAASSFGFRTKPSSARPDTMTACYLTSSVPSTLDMVAKYTSDTNENLLWTGLIANANVGGENVHRGSILGAILGARAASRNVPSKLIDGLYDKDSLSREIDDFVDAVMNQKCEEQ